MAYYNNPEDAMQWYFIQPSFSVMQSGPQSRQKAMVMSNIVATDNDNDS